MLVWYVMSSCILPSVCLSIKYWSSPKLAKARIMQTTQYDSPATPIFWCQRSQRNFSGNTLSGGLKYRRGRLKFVIFDQYTCRRCNQLSHFWRSVVGCRFCRGSKFSICPWEAQLQLIQGWCYRASCDDRESEWTIDSEVADRTLKVA